VGALLRDRDENVAVVEGTSAGLVNAALQGVPRASTFLAGALTIYSARAAKELVPIEVLRKLGRPKDNYADAQVSERGGCERGCVLLVGGGRGVDSYGSGKQVVGVDSYGSVCLTVVRLKVVARALVFSSTNLTVPCSPSIHVHSAYGPSLFSRSVSPPPYASHCRPPLPHSPHFPPMPPPPLPPPRPLRPPLFRATETAKSPLRFSRRTTCGSGSGRRGRSRRAARRTRRGFLRG
jgi:hypothetical protein